MSGLFAPTQNSFHLKQYNSLMFTQDLGGMRNGSIAANSLNVTTLAPNMNVSGSEPLKINPPRPDSGMSNTNLEEKGKPYLLKKKHTSSLADYKNLLRGSTFN